MNANDFSSGKQPENIVYKEISNKKLNLQVIKPDDWTENDKRTAIVWIHGGGWTSGTPDFFIPHCRYFAKRGAVCFSVQYRFAEITAETAREEQGTTVEECVSDCKSAIRFIRKNANQLGIHPDRIIAGGDSAGGHLAVSLGTLDGFDSPEDDLLVSARPDAVIDCNGIIDMTLKWKNMIPYSSSPEKRSIEPDAISSWHERHARACALSPIYNIRSGQPPVLIMQGLKDTVVEPEDSYRYFQAVKTAGNHAELVFLPKAEHAFVLFNYSSTEEELKHIIHTMDEFLIRLGYLDGHPLL